MGTGRSGPRRQGSCRLRRGAAFLEAGSWERSETRRGDADTAIKRKELGDILARLDLVPIDDQLMEMARSSFSVNVRALDAIHVATAEVLAAESRDDSLEFWTHDERQATAALSRGLTVLGL